MTYAVEIEGLVRKFGKTDAVNGLNMRVPAGTCYGLFGRNGAGKSTTIKCLLNLLRPTAGSVRVFGIDPRRDEVAVKSRIGYVPEVVAFYPWMTTRGVLEYSASFRKHWSAELEADLLSRFGLDPDKKVRDMSKGMKAQLGLICAVCPEPDMLLLDEPTSGLDPIVRREFLQTVIGAYQESAPGQRTILVSTHLISEWEGLIDEFSIIDKGKEVLSIGADQARERFKKLRLAFSADPPQTTHPAVTHTTRDGRNVVLFTAEYSEKLETEIAASWKPEAVSVENLTLEEIFIAAGQGM